MKLNWSLRNVSLAAVAILAIGVAACGANDSDDAPTSSPSSAGSIGAAPSDGMSVFDSGKALGDVDSEESARNAGEASAGSAGAPSPNGPVAQGGGTLATTVDRKIVSTASIQMQVENVGGSFEEVGRIATSAGGFVASSSFSYKGEDQLASVTIRVPSESYQSVLGSLRALGVRVDAENSDATDVTEEYTDLGARLRTLEATETQLLTLLGQAETISDILTVQDRLNFTRTEIEQVKGRIQLLDDLTDLATITVHLRPVVAGNGGGSGGTDLGSEVSEAWDESIEFLGEVAAAVVTIVVFAWWVPVVGLPLLIGYRAVSRRRDGPATVAD